MYNFDCVIIPFQNFPSRCKQIKSTICLVWWRQVWRKETFKAWRTICLLPLRQTETEAESNREERVRWFQRVCSWSTSHTVHQTTGSGAGEREISSKAPDNYQNPEGRSHLPFSCCLGSHTSNWGLSWLPLCHSASGTWLRNRSTWNVITKFWWSFGHN